MLEYRNCPLCGSEDHMRLSNYKHFVREFTDDGPMVEFCKNCGLIFLNPIMSHQDYQEFYNKDAQKKFVFSIVKEDYAAKIKKQTQERIGLIRGFLLAGGVLLDVGCGYSDFFYEVRKYAMSSFGLDPSIQRAKADSNVICGSLKDWAEEKKVDIITAFQVLEHLTEPRDFLECAMSRLNVGGKIIIEVPNHDDVLVSLDIYKRFYYQNAHCSYFNLYTLNKLLMDSGFKINRVIPMQRYSLSNHTHWLFFGRSGRLRFLSFLDGIYSWMLKKTHRYDTILIVASK